MICLDSDFIVDYLKGKKAAVEALSKYKDEVVTTEINAFEVFYGIYLKEKVSENEKLFAKEFFDTLGVLPFDEECGEIGAKILTALSKQGLVIEQNNCLIASIILKNGFGKILTGNKKHFNRIKNLHVVSY